MKISSSINSKDVLRFYSKIKLTQESDGCWEFSQIGGVHGCGYFHINRKTYRASRVAWRIFYGKWPTKWVLHKCDNPSCVRPDHLFEGTHRDNMQDASRKGRLPWGERNWNSRLTLSQVKQIIKLKSKFKQAILGRYFGVKAKTISAIQRGTRWRGAHI
jgi:hypothetical protein